MAKKVNPVSIEESLIEAGKTVKEFAEHVEKISDGMKALLDSPLKYSTIVMLVAKAAGVAQGDAERVLNALPELRKKYLKN